MNFPEFARGYSRPPSSRGSRHTFSIPEADAKVEDLLAEPRKWNSFLEELTYDYLRGYEMWDADMEHADIDAYVDRNKAYFKDIQLQLEEMALQDPSLLPFLTELNFHLIAPHLSTEWHGMVESNAETRSKTSLTRAQSALAVASFELYERLTQYGEQAAGPFTGYINGQLTEMDTMIVQVDRARKLTTSHILSVPAPSRFENMSAKINSDSLDVDETYREVRGLQSKSYESGNVEKNRSYDRRFVTVIDGFGDLDNRVPVFSDEGLMMYVPKPGLIGAEHLRRIAADRLPDFKNPQKQADLLRMKQAAAAVLPQRPAAIPRAVYNIEAKMRADIRKTEKSRFLKKRL